MERQDDPQLWDLLGRAKAPEPSPFFARNVLRAVRNDSVSSGAAQWPWLSWRRLLPTFSAVAALVVAVMTFQTVHRQPPAAGRDSIASFNVSDSELATDLDVLGGDDDDDAPLL